MNDATLDELREAYADMRRHQAEANHAALTQADARFHRVIAITSANQAVLHVFDQLEPFARTFITLTLPRVDVTTIIAEHGMILEALERGDASLAASCARTHQLNVSELFREHFEPADRVTADGSVAHASCRRILAE